MRGRALESGTDQIKSGCFSGLRILGFCDHFTESSSGGAEKVTAEIYARLQAQGAEVAVLSAVGDRGRGVGSLLGVSTYFVPALDLSRVLNAQVTLAPGLLAAGRRLIDEFQPQVMHATSVHFQGSIAAALHARRCRLPLVTTGHVASVEWLRPTTRAATVAYENTIGRFILGSSKMVIAVSEEVAVHLGSLGAPSENVRVVPNGVDHERFTPGCRADAPVEVVFVGRLIQNKGPADALAAFAAVGPPRARLTFVGDGPMRAQLETATKRLELSSMVRFTGHLNDVSTVLRSAHIFIRPSRTEGLSLAVLEAMASEMAVLASDIPANRELVRHGESGLLASPGDRVDLARQLDKLLTDAPLRHALAARGRERAAQYSWDVCARETGQVLADAAGDW